MEKQKLNTFENKQRETFHDINKQHFSAQLDTKEILAEIRDNCTEIVYFIALMWLAIIIIFVFTENNIIWD